MFHTIIEKDNAANADLFAELNEVNGAVVKLPTLQKAMIVRMQDAGGKFVADGSKKDADLRTLNSLREKGLVTVGKSGGEKVWMLTDVTVSAADVVKPVEEAAGAVEFRNSCKEIFRVGYQKKVAEILGVNRATVAKWCQGVLPVPQHALVFIEGLQHCVEYDIPMPPRVAAYV